MKYIRRDLERRIREIAEDYSCILPTGARQVGKTTLFKHMDPEREVVTLDDLEERRLAQTDPEMFLQVHEPPVLIAEVQHAPQLFPYLKMAIDAGATPRGKGAVVCMRPELSAADSENFIVPVWMI